MKTWEKLKKHPELWERYFVREQVLTAIRAFFSERHFHEIETPLLIARPPAESYLDVFETTLLDRARRGRKAYLSTSPEVPLKKLMVAGLGNCFSLTKSFRNMETQSLLHNPEFTMVEWYRAPATYKDIMVDCEELVLHIHTHLQRMAKNDTQKSNQLIYQGKTIDLEAPWEKISVAEAFSRWAKVDFNTFFNMDTAKRIAQSKGYAVEPETTWEQIYNQIFLNEIEPHLGQGKPTILYDFPGSMAALCKKSSDPRFAERFEFYIQGLELGDCYGELTDWKEQKDRFDKELEEIRRQGKTSYDYDHDFIDALKAGLPESSGVAVGVDRLVMLFADVINIADTLFFPASELFED
jgi:elongation factor P--(R)-beta-lysine ligase